MRLLYTALFIISMPLLILRLIWRGFSTPTYWQRWAERFGFSPTISHNAPIIWIHAVSVGEVEACRPLVKQLQTAFPEHKLLITTMTPTGSDRVKLVFDDRVFHCYLPYDIPFAIYRFLDRINPEFGIIMETEIWPNLLFCCQKRAIPLVLANARLSERSAKGYGRFPHFIKTILQSLPLIAAQSQNDRQRFIELGAKSENVHAIGNLKYEITLPASLLEQADALRHLWDRNRPVWVAASTHEGEEEMVINASRQVRAHFPDLLLIIVPRHPQRFDRVATLANKAGFKTLRRSDQQACPADVQILIVDTMGELPLFYAASDVAFVGGSLVPHGGHNILEPAALGRAIITGPHYFNFNEITTDFLAAKAALEVHDTQSLAEVTIELLQNPQQRSQMGEAAQQLIASSQKTSSHLINLIKFTLTHYEK